MIDFNKTFDTMKQRLNETFQKNKDKWAKNGQWKNGKWRDQRGGKGKNGKPEKSIEKETTEEYSRNNNQAKKEKMPLIVPLILLICGCSWVALCCIVAKKHMRKKEAIQARQNRQEGIPQANPYNQVN